MNPRATRADAWWATLTPEQTRKALELVKAHGIKPETCAVIAGEFSVEAPSRSALGRFYQWARSEETAWNIEKALADKAELVKLLENVGDINEAVMAGLSQLYMDAIIARDPAAMKAYGEQLAMLMAGRSKAQDVEIKLRRLRALEDKIAEAKARLAAASANAGKGGISPETLKTIEDSLNLL